MVAYVSGTLYILSFLEGYPKHLADLNKAHPDAGGDDLCTDVVAQVPAVPAEH